MIAQSIRRQRADDVLEEFSSGRGSVFFTLTTPDVVDIFEIRARWRSLRHYLVQQVFPKGTKYIMNYEIHPCGHGWHIHSVWNHYVPLTSIFSDLRRFGFGRVDVRRVNSTGVAEYLTKHALKAYRGVSARMREDMEKSRLRLVNQSRGLPRLSDYAWISTEKSELRDCLKSCSRQLDFRRASLLASIGTSFGFGGLAALDFAGKLIDLAQGKQ